MPKLDAVVSWLDEYLEIGRVQDVGLNGLQVEGRSEVKRVAAAVDACMETFEKAAAGRVDLMIVHHGLFWKPMDPRPVGLMGRRLKKLWESGTSLYAAHLPLDLHEEVGNNVQFLKKIGLKPASRFGEFRGVEIGYYAEPARGMKIEALAKRIDRVLGRPCRLYAFSGRPVRRVGVVTGDGASSFHDAAAKGIDTLITGEPDFTVYHYAKEQEANLIFAGHYLTEQFGVQALSARLAKRFPSLKTGYIENPVDI